MKLNNFVLVPLLVLTLAGCGTLIPKRVEFFQKKVKAVPVASESQKETEREAAYLASIRARATVEAALSNSASPAVVEPARDTEALTKAVSTSLGPPITPYLGGATNLAARVEKNAAKLNAAVTDYAHNVQPLVGKKIEGTGLIRIPYFVYIGGIALVIFLAWTALKVYGAVNPIVGLGTNTVGRLSGAALSEITAEVVKGGEIFKEQVLKSELAAEAKTQVLKLFQSAHDKAQSRDTQKVIETLTVKPSQV